MNTFGAPDDRARSVQSSLLTLLNWGLLDIRKYAEGVDLERTAIEANHLHNIPGLLRDFSIDLLKLYLDIEMPQYVLETHGQVLAEIRAAWAELVDWRSTQGAMQ